MSRCGLLLLAGLVLLSGCRSAFVNATVRNDSGGAITLIEVDYPSASFGVQSLAPAAELHYRFKILGSGPLKLTYTDASGREHAVAGPFLREGSDGTLMILVQAEGTVRWQPRLR